MKKVLMVMLTAIAVVGCSPSTKPVDHSFVIPKELSHCSMYNMYDGYRNLYVMHCPNATTSVSVPGKHPSYAIVVDE